MPPIYPGQNQYVPPAPSVPQPQYAATAAIPTIKYGGFWLRGAPLVIDGLVLGVTNIILALVLGNGIVGVLIRLVVGLGYPVLMVTYYQATLGKMAVGLRIQRTNGERIGFWRAVLRETIGKFLSGIILGFGYFMVGWTQKKQGLHDKIADTVVVEKDPTKSKTVWVVIGVIFGATLPIIAIVGIFSSIVLASLNVARQKGSDAMVKSQLSTVQVQAELYYGGVGNGSYLGYCNSPEALTALAAASTAGTAGKNTTSYVCNDSKDTWAASAPLRTTTSYECVASTGAMTEIASPLATDQTSCGPSALPVQ